MFSRACSITLPVIAALLFVSCSEKNASGYNPEVGPFDENGNYVEAWADNPPKKGSWRKSSSSSKPKTITVSKPEPTPVKITKPTVSRPVPPVAKVSTPRPEPRPEPAPKPVSKPKPKPVAKPTPKPAPKPKPKPAPVKAKPSFSYHTVSKGDTLYSLARKFGVSVRSIQQANGMSGTNIRIGQSLKIPAK